MLKVGYPRLHAIDRAFRNTSAPMTAEPKFRKTPPSSSATDAHSTSFGFSMQPLNLSIPCPAVNHDGLPGRGYRNYLTYHAVCDYSVLELVADDEYVSARRLFAQLCDTFGDIGSSFSKSSRALSTSSPEKTNFIGFI